MVLQFGESNARKFAEKFIDIGSRGVGEVAEESTQELIQIWQSTENGKGFMEELKERFPDADSAEEFLLSTFMMGIMFGNVSHFQEKYAAYKKKHGDSKVVNQVVSDVADANTKTNMKASQENGINDAKEERGQEGGGGG